MKKSLFVLALSAVVACAPAQVSFLLQSVSFAPIAGFPASPASYGVVINSSGRVVGELNAYDADGENIARRAYSSFGGSTTNLGLLDPSQEISLAFGINDLDDVVGDSGAEATLFSGGTTTGLGLLAGGEVSLAYGINNSGLIVGTALDADGNSRAVTFGPGGPTVLNIPGSALSQGLAVSNSGFIAGDTSTNAAGSGARAFRSNGPSVEILNPLPGGTFATVTGVNDFGVVIGYGNSTGGGQEDFYSNGTDVTGIGKLPGCNFSRAFGMNNPGVVVGSASRVGAQTAIIYQGGQLVDLNSLLDPSVTGWTLLGARGINDHGQIVGTGRFNGEIQAFVLNPVPEPGTMLALSVGLLALRRRGKKSA
jgi:hypothetical protein